MEGPPPVLLLRVLPMATRSEDAGTLLPIIIAARSARLPIVIQPCSEGRLSVVPSVTATVAGSILTGPALEATRTLLRVSMITRRTLTVRLAAPIWTMIPVAVEGTAILAVAGHRPTEVLLLAVEGAALLHRSQLPRIGQLLEMLVTLAGEELVPTQFAR